MHRSLPLSAALLALAGCAQAAAEPAPAAAPFGATPDAAEPVAATGGAVCEDRLAGGATYDTDAAVVSHPSPGGGFRVHYTTSPDSAHAVPADDVDGDGVPDRVEAIADTFDEAAAFFAGRGWRAPVDDADRGPCDGGDARFDVYVLELGRANGLFTKDEGCEGPGPRPCSGFIRLDRDLDAGGFPSFEAGLRTVASHELFHAIQSAYDAFQDAVGEEGSAVWASERFDPTLDDFERFVPGYLATPDRSLDDADGTAGLIDPFAYGAALFFRHVEEAWGPDAVRETWEALPDFDGAAPPWPLGLDAALARRGGSLEEAFHAFARWNLFTGDAADPTRGYAEGARYPAVNAEPATLPVERLTFRVDRLSTRYLRLDPGDRARIAAVLRVPTNRAQSLVGLEAFVAVRRGDRWGDPVVLDPPTIPREIDVAGADEVVFATSHAWLDRAATDPRDRVAVPARIPALCVGTAAEVDACLARVDPLARDAGVAPAGDAGVPLPDDPGAGGCAAAGAPAGAGASALLLGLAWALRRPPRRRRGPGRPA